MFDIIKSLNEREQHFLIHARLGHLPRKAIMQMIKNGTTGIQQYSGKFKELCKPCLQAKQRAENHGHQHKRHPDGKPGEHLHSDLAVVSTLDMKGNKYVLTVVDEISQEICIGLLKKKTAEEVCNMSKKIQTMIAARTGNKLLTWQFDRGTEFLNSKFETWLKLELGVEQRFSNIEHPWENGKAERSFQTLFALSRSLLKHADLPDPTLHLHIQPKPVSGNRRNRTNAIQDKRNYRPYPHASIRKPSTNFCQTKTKKRQEAVRQIYQRNLRGNIYKRQRIHLLDQKANRISGS